MTWFKVDDGWWSHPKVIPLECSDPRSIWVTAGSWCAQHLTDGYLPEYALKMITDLRGSKLKAACDDLVEAGLWRRAPGGYQFHDWEKYQPSRAEIEKRREADRERKSLGRIRRKESERSPRGIGAESASPVPSRPVQTPQPPSFAAVMRDLADKVAADEEAESALVLSDGERDNLRRLFDGPRKSHSTTEEI